MNFKNMKIEINQDQPIEDVVKELERLGYCYNCGCDDKDAKMIKVNSHFEQYDIYSHVVNNAEIITISQLKEMK